MNYRFLLTVLTAAALCSWTPPTKPGYLYLNSGQLKPLGIELNENGVFYKNFNPEWKQDQRKYSCMYFYCCNNNYVTTNHYFATDSIKAHNKSERLIMKMGTTKNDFYPLLIGSTRGEQSLENETLPAGMKLLPVAICMSETKLPDRKDTIVVWFKPTESLKKALPANISIDEYLQLPVRKKK
jgi:hypothetical protein